MTTFDLIFKYTLIFSLAALVVGFIVYIIKHQITTKIDCTTVKVTDEMDGHDFEYWCADLLKRSGFKDVAVVITNNTFTPSAIELAESAVVDLWDEDVLENLQYKIR